MVATVEVLNPNGELVDYPVQALPDAGDGPRWQVTSPKGDAYVVQLRTWGWACTCEDHRYRRRVTRFRRENEPCKHATAVRDRLFPRPVTAIARQPQRTPMDAIPTPNPDAEVPDVPEDPGGELPRPEAAGGGPATAVCDVQPGGGQADVLPPAQVNPAICPFCLSEDVVTRSDRDWDSYVTCLGCGAIGPSGKDAAGAVAKWNRRQAG